MRLIQKNPKRVIAVAGCKGGTGKTLIAVNLALVLAEQGQRVVLMDGNLAVPDVGVSLGLDKELDVNSVSPVAESMDSLLLSGPSGIKVLSPANEHRWRERIEIADTVHLINQMDALASSLDTLIIDTAPSMAPDTATLVQAAGEIIIVLNQDLVSLEDAVRQIRMLYHEFKVYSFRIVVNAVSSRRYGTAQFKLLQDHLNDEKQIVLSYLGSIPFDKSVSESLNQQAALVKMSPQSRAAKALRRLGQLVTALPVPEPGGRIEFFMPTRIRERV